MPYNPIAYVREAGAPGELGKHVADIQGSGLVTVILGMLHIGDPEKDKTMELGDFIYNNYPADLIVRGGKFNPNGTQAIKDWPAQVAQLKQQGSVSSVFLSIGSPPKYWKDFGAIEKMFKAGNADLLKQNIVALKEAFTIGGRCTIDGFDIDCEEEYDIRPDTVPDFCEILFAQGFQVTFCPYRSPDWWQPRMQTLWDKGRYVSGWNLQCYAGGMGNWQDLSSWLEALASVVGKEKAPRYLVPGFAVKSATDVCPKSDRICPSEVERRVAGWKSLELGGVFLWMYDSLNETNSSMCDGKNTLTEYVKAIKQG